MLTLVHYPAGSPLDKASITPEHKFAKTGCSSATISTPGFGTAAYAGIALVGTTVTMIATTSIIGTLWLLRATSSLSALAPSTGSLARILRMRLGCKEGGRKWTKLPTVRALGSRNGRGGGRVQVEQLINGNVHIATSCGAGAPRVQRRPAVEIGKVGLYEGSGRRSYSRTMR